MAGYDDLVKKLEPKDWTEKLDPEERIEFDRRYGGKADETVSFLAANKALPWQNDVESFEDPDLFTSARRRMGFYTSKEQALLKKQQRLIEGELKPIQQGRQAIAKQLAVLVATTPPDTEEATQGVTGPAARTIGLQAPGTPLPGPMQPGPQLAQGPNLQMPPAGPQGGLLPPPLQVAQSQDLVGGQPPMMIRPPEGPNAALLAEMPIGTPGAGPPLMPYASPDQPVTGLPVGYEFPQNYAATTQVTGVRDWSGMPAATDPPSYEQTIRDQPIQMADRKLLPPPPPVAGKRDLKLWERKQLADMLDAQARGQFVVNEKTGTLIPLQEKLAEEKQISEPEYAAQLAIADQEAAQLEINQKRRNNEPIPGDLMIRANQRIPFPGGGISPTTLTGARQTAMNRAKALEERRAADPELVKLQKLADSMPADDPRKAEVEQRIRRLSAEGGRTLNTQIESLALQESKKKHGKAFHFAELADRDPELAERVRTQAEVTEPRNLVEFKERQDLLRQLAAAGPVAEAGARATNQVKTESSLAPGVMILDKVNKLVDETPNLFLDEGAGLPANLKHMADLRTQYFRGTNPALREWVQIEDGMRASLARMTGEVGNLAATEQERAKMLLPDLYGSLYGVPDSKQIAKKKIALFGDFMKAELEAAQGADPHSRVQAKLNEVLGKLDKIAPLPDLGELLPNELELAETLRANGLDKRMVHMELLKRRGAMR